MPQDRDRVDRFLPLKPFVLDVLLELADGKRHGWSLIRDIQQRDGGDRILPANFYRTLRALRDDGLIEEAKGDANEDPGERRQYFSLTSLGARVARAEVKRLEALVVDPRARRLLKASRLDHDHEPAARSIDCCCGCCPPDLQREFGAEMEAMFLQSLAARARLGKVRVWARALADVLRHGLGARQGQLAEVSKDVGVRRVRHHGGSGWIRFATICGTRYERCRASPPRALIIVLTLALGDRRQHGGVLRGAHRADQAAAVRRSPIRS